MLEHLPFQSFNKDEPGLGTFFDVQLPRHCREKEFKKMDQRRGICQAAKTVNIVEKSERGFCQQLFGAGMQKQRKSLFDNL